MRGLVGRPFIPAASPSSVGEDGVEWYPNDTPVTVQQAAPAKPAARKRVPGPSKVKKRAARKQQHVAKLATLYADHNENLRYADVLLAREVAATAAVQAGKSGQDPQAG
jgi:hypothetical protein